ncbi:MAG: hypothetical protein ACLR06_01060 [Christensenellaceae bacterium]
MFFYALGVLCCSTVCIFNIALRFQKNLFSGEGYLTLSIPATPEEHILSKSISGFVAIVLTVLVAVGSLLIVAVPYGSQIFPKIGELLGNLGILYRDYTVDAVFLTIELVLFLLFYVIFNIQVIYSCMCVGHLCVNKSRGVRLRSLSSSISRSVRRSPFFLPLRGPSVPFSTRKSARTCSSGYSFSCRAAAR